MSDDEATIHQIKGKCDGMMSRGEWREFHINIGKQYPVKLSTKQPDVIDKALAAGERDAVWTYSEKQGGANPHRPGEFFKNRYLSNVEVGGELDPTIASGQMSIANAQGGGGNAGAGMPSTEGREVSIERQSLVKASLPIFNLFDGEDAFFTFIDRLDDWMGRERAKAAVEEPEKPAEPAADPNPTPPDDQDDIPF